MTDEQDRYVTLLRKQSEKTWSYFLGLFRVKYEVWENSTRFEMYKYVHCINVRVLWKSFEIYIYSPVAKSGEVD